MIMDAQLEFSKEQAVTAAAASTNVIDLNVARDIGVGENLFLVVQVVETFADGSSNSTLAVKLETDDNAAFSSATDLRDLVTFAALTAAGTIKVFKLEPGLAYEQYLRLYFTPANGDLSAGKVSAYLTKDVTLYTQYANGYSIT